MASVCTSGQFRYNAAGVLGLSLHGLPRVVATDTTASSGDGELKYPDDDGKIMVDQELHWANTYPCAVKVLPILKRQSRLLHTTGSVLLVVREHTTWFVGQDREQRVQAADPSPGGSFDSQWGGGDTVGAGTDGASAPRTYTWQSDAESTHALPFVTVPVDRSISVRHRSIGQFLRYFADTAEADTNELYVRGNTITLLAFPTPEESS